MSEPVAFRRVYGLESYSRTSGESNHHRQSVSDTRVPRYQLSHEDDLLTNGDLCVQFFHFFWNHFHRDIAIWGLYRTVCVWGTIHWVAILRSWFDFHSTCSQFVRPNSRRFLARLRLRCGIFLPMLGHFAGTFFPFSFTHNIVVDQVIYLDCGCRHRYTSTQRLVGQRSSLQRWAILCFMSLELADGANSGPDYLGSTDECLGPGGYPSANNSTGCCQFFAQQSVCHYATLGAALDRINSESNSLGREVSS